MVRAKALGSRGATGGPAGGAGEEGGGQEGSEGGGRVGAGVRGQARGGGPSGEGLPAAPCSLQSCTACRAGRVHVNTGLLHGEGDGTHSSTLA